MMGSFTLDYRIILIFAATVKVCIGNFYKIEHHELTSLENRVLYEDAFKCDRKETCKQFTTYASLSPNRSPRIDRESSIKFTKMPDSNVYPSCAVAFAWNSNREGMYRIQHQNMAYFLTVQCTMINNTVTAISHHDIENPIEVKGHESPCSYRKKITYARNLEQIKQFVDSSTSCRQFTRVNCKNMMLFSASTQYGSLHDRNGISMSYFGGGPRDGKGCKCGITNSCKKNGTVCNCDINDSHWHNDEGYVVDMQRLPLTKACFGDTGHEGEAGIISIGPLECQET